MAECKTVELLMSKRKRSRIVEEEEEEEDEDGKRRLSARKRNRVKYNEDDDDDGGDDDDDDDDEEEELYGEQQGPSAQNDPPLNLNGRVLPVTCGDKKGMLYKDRLAKGEECILSAGVWFIPSAFEGYAGRGCAKKWKHSILYGNDSLQVLFENGALITPGYNHKAAHTKEKTILSLDHDSESSSEESIEQSDETVDSDDVEDTDRLFNSGSTEQELATGTEEDAEQRTREEEENKDDDSGAEEEMEYGEDGITRRKPDDDDDDDSVFEGRRTKTQRILKVQLERLREDKTDHHSNSTEPPSVEDGERGRVCPDAHGQSRVSGDATERASTRSTATQTSQTFRRSPVPVSRTEKNGEETSVIPAPEPASVLQVPNEAAPSPMTRAEETLPGSIEASAGGEMEGPSLTGPNAMSLDELKRQKVIMQLKVLQLQVEYYSIKINKHKH